MTKYQELVSLINKIIPERTEKLGFGVEILIEEQHSESEMYTVCNLVSENEIEIFNQETKRVRTLEPDFLKSLIEINYGTPLTVTDILIALERKYIKADTQNWYVLSTNGNLQSTDGYGISGDLASINLSLPLSAPENEPAVRELIKLLK